MGRLIQEQTSCRVWNQRFDELRDLDQECDEFEHSLTKLQAEVEAESTNELK